MTRYIRDRQICNIWKGDMIYYNDTLYTVGKVLFRDFFEGTWDVEFLDAEGNYHHWEQASDGGRIIKGRKRMINCHGVDVTDLFIKYHQPY